MSTPIEELTALVDALRAETIEQSITPERIGAILQRMIDVLPSVSDANSLKGWVAITSINELPSNPSPTQRTLAYLLNTTLYVYVGSGGDTLEGKYRSAELKGTKGDTGGPGPGGSAGKSAYQSYYDTTQDNPKKTEAEWASSLLGGAAIVNNLESDSEVDALAAAMGKRLKELLKDTAAPTETVNIPFDGGGRYIDRNDGAVRNNSSWVSTQYIEVNEGDEFIYTGNPGSASKGVAGYELVDGQYVYKKTFVDYGTSLKQDVLIIIPSGITHIIAVDKKSGSESFTTQKSSALSEITDNLGELASTTLIPYETFTSGYITNRGVISSGGKHVLVDVKIGDEISLYDYVAYGSSGETTIGKQLTETTFEPLVLLDTGTYKLYTYTATENMTIGVSAYRQDIRMLVVRRNRTTMWDATTEGLAQTREEITQTNEWVDHYDMKLGCMFENIAVIGDSMARGTLGGESDPNLGADDTGLSSHGASWLSCLAKRWGCKSKFHYTMSGTGCYNWLNNQGSVSGKYGLGRFLADIANSKVYNAYFIAYGHNDSPSAGVGTAEDEAAVVTFTDGQPSCADTYTFCAYYKAIINQIRANAPHAMIFCLSEYDNVMKNNKPTYRQAVIDVADWYYEQGDHLVHHLETGGVPYSGMDLGTHYSTVGYACIAKLVDNEVNRVIYQYRGDIEIKYFGSYNTDHDADSPWE